MTETVSLPLLEREDEAAALVAAVERANRGSGALVVIDGHPGVGKTSLLSNAAAAAQRRGFTVLACRAGEVEREVVLSVIHRLFQHASPGDAAATKISDVTQFALAASTDELDPTYGVAHRLNSALAELAAETPLMLCVDDAQWADPASLRLLYFIASRAEGQRLLVVVTARTGDVHAGDPALRTLWESSTQAIRLRSLSKDSTASVLHAAAGGPVSAQVVDAFQRATRGNPFLTTELVNSLVMDGFDLGNLTADAVASTVPDSILTSALFRIGRLSPAAGPVARAVAILGDAPPVHHVAALAEVEEDDAMVAASELVRACIFARERPLTFEHPLIASAVRGDIDPNTRSIAHARAAKLLLAEGAAAETVAPHLLQTQPSGDAQTVSLLRAAADVAMSRGAPALAVHLLHRALAEPPSLVAVRGDLLNQLGSAEQQAGLIQEAVAHVREGLSMATSPAQLAARATSLATAVGIESGPGAAIAVLDEALEQVPPAADDLRLMLTANAYQYSLFDIDTFNAWGRRLDSLAPPSRPDTPAARAVLAMLACRRLYFGGTATEVAALARAALGEGQLAGDLTTNAAPFQLAIFAAVESGDLVLAQRELKVAESIATSRGSASVTAAVGAARVYLDDRLGDLRRLDETIAVSRMALEADSSSPLTMVFSVFFGVAEALVRSEEGDGAAVDQLLHSVGMDRDASFSNIFLSIPWRARSRLHLGKYGKLRADVDLIQDALSRTGSTWNPAAPWRAWAAGVHATEGNFERSRELAAEELEHARAWGSDHALGIALRARGVAEPGMGALPWLEDAVDAFEQSGCGVESARTRVELGAALRRVGRRTAARGPLTAGLDGALHTGASALAKQARSELRLAGAKPRRDYATGVEALTAAERRVASMAAERYTNREIAQSLFVSIKTVEGHLRQVYGKLGIAGRSDLPVALKASI